MGRYKLLVVRDDPQFLNAVEQAVKVLGDKSESFGVPSLMRTVGSIGMLKPTDVIIDMDANGAQVLLNDIIVACKDHNAELILFSPSNDQAARAQASEVGARWFTGARGDELVDWIVGGYGVDGEAATAGGHQIAERLQEVAEKASPASRDFLAPSDDGSSTSVQPKVAKPQTSAPAASPGAESQGFTRTGIPLPSMDELLIEMLDKGASDLHITNGSAPRIRIRGELVEIADQPKLYGEETAKIIMPIVDDKRLAAYNATHELDFSYSIPGKSRFRVNVFRQRGAMGAVLRTIPFGIPSIDSLGLPPVCKDLADRPRGLVLVTGPTGSGKSTTLAAMIDYINDTKAVHIMTMEDPIEFMHQNKKALINQREIGEDTDSFASALKRVLRQDPDVILVGEMRDLETISAAITAAETGHLVFGTLHTIGGPETVDRIIDVFPPEQQSQIRMQLSNSLQGVLSQVLCQTADGKGRILAQEIMLGIPAIANLIREGKTHQMPSIIQSSGSIGMTTLDQSLKRLANAGKITIDTAIEKSQDHKTMAESFGRAV